MRGDVAGRCEQLSALDQWVPTLFASLLLMYVGENDDRDAHGTRSIWKSSGEGGLDPLRKNCNINSLSSNEVPKFPIQYSLL